MESDWKKRMPNTDPEYAAKRAIAKDAHLSGCLVYSMVTGIWYTPKAFMESKESVSIHRGKDDGEKKYRIMDPKAGLRQKLEALKKAQSDLQEFTGMISEYYDFIAKVGRS